MSTTPSPSADPLDEVDPFIGVDGPGAVLCGPYVPLALVRLSPDTVPPHRTNGYRSDLPLLGFSHTHVSGTGGEGRFGNVRVMPFLGDRPPDSPAWERVAESARMGLYQVTIGGVHVALTSSARCGVTRLTYPLEQSGGLVVDAGAVHHHGSPRSACCVEAHVETVGDRCFAGRGTFRGGWGHDHPYDIYFFGCVTEAWDRHSLDENGRQLRLHWDAASLLDGTVEARIGVSFASVEHARASLEREIAGKPFDVIVEEHRAQWRPWFERLKVSGGSTEQRRIFHTFLTRLLCMPTDLGVKDEFIHWPSEVRHFSEFYALWDSVRNANSLITLIAPELERDFLNCLLDVAAHRSWLPDAWITGHSTKVQGREIAQGGVLELELSTTPTEWGRAGTPPSPMADAAPDHA